MHCTMYAALGSLALRGAWRDRESVPSRRLFVVAGVTMFTLTAGLAGASGNRRESQT